MAVRAGRRRRCLAAAFVVMVQVFGVATMSPSTARADAFTVVDVGDIGDLAPGDGVCETADGVCTLRAALEEANATPGRDTIAFDLPGGGVHRIDLTAELPTLIDPAGTVIDGYSQPGAVANVDTVAFDATILIELVGTGPSGIDGFVINGPNNVIRGLSIFDFRRGIRLFGVDAHDNEIVGNLLGTDTTGTFASDEYVRGSMAVNIQAAANNNRIGMPGDANRNVISGNYQHGVALYDNNTVDNVIQNNLIGFTPDGTGPLMNRGHGVDINTWASDTLVGGTEPGERNVIAATGQSGVEVSHGPGTLGNRVIGNWIGTSADGATAPVWAAITQFGVNLEGVAVCDDVCEPDMADAVVTDNVIVNATGGVILHKATYGNVVADNLIGVLPDGTPAPHSVFGVRIEKGAFDNVIGPGNEIANSPNGVQLVPDGSNPPSPEPVATGGNTITQNSIHDNGGLGIDLYPLGSVTAAPVVEVNNGAAIPSITATTSSSATVSACVGCTVELFRSDGDAGVFGEGEEFVGAAVVPAGDSVTIQLPASAHGAAVTATSTTPEGSTSEFSNSIAVSAPSPTNTPPTAAVDVDCDVTTCTFDATGSSDVDGTIEWYEWDFGDGATVTTAEPMVAHDYLASGSFGVTLDVVDSDAATTSITTFADPFNLAPTADFSIACDLQLCSFISDAVDPDGAIVERTWDFGGVGSSTDTNPTFAFPGGGTFVVTHGVTDSSTSTASSSQSVAVAPFPNGLIALDGFSRALVDGWADAPMGGPWIYPLDNQQDFSVAGNRGLIAIDAVAGLRKAVLGELTQQDVTVTATVRTDKDPVGWGLTSFVAARHVDENTEYRARLRQSGSGSVYLTLIKTVGSTAQIAIGSETLVPGLSSEGDAGLRVSLSVTGTNPTTLQAKVWADGDAEPTAWALTETDDEPVLQLIGAVAVGAAPGSSHTDLPVEYRFDDVQVVTDNDPPVASIEASCVNTTCSFSALGSSDPDGAIVFSAWDFGDGASIAGGGETSPSHTYADFGTYDVTLTVTDDQGGSGTVTVPVDVVNAVPVPTMTWSCDELACSFDSLGSFDPDGLIVGYQWNFADGVTSTDVAPSHTYATTDIYTVTLTVTDDDGGEDTATVTIEPTLAPTADFTHTCELTTCTFDGAPSSDPDGTIVAYAWDFGDGASGEGIAPEHTFAAGGPYDVALTVFDNVGTSGSISLPVDPNAPPAPVIAYACDDTDCLFDASGSIDSDGSVVAYAWDFGDGVTSTDATPTHVYPSNGTFTVSLEVTDDEGGVAVATEDVGISATPVATFVVSCVLLECSVDGTGSNDPDGTAITYAWDFDDGATADGQTAAHTYLDGEPRTITLSVTDESGSIGSATEAINPDAPPQAAFGFSCDGLACSFDAAASSDDDGIAAYEWDFDDGTTAIGPTATHTYAAKAAYAVSLTVTDVTGNPATATVVVVPNLPPVAAFTVSCPSATCEFDASSSVDPDGAIADIAWDFGDGATATGLTATHTYDTLDDRIVTVTVTDDDGAVGTATGTASPNELPSASFEVSCTLNVCSVDASTSADADGTISGYAWDWGDGAATATGMTAEHTYDTVVPTEIVLTVTDDVGGTASTSGPISLTREFASDAYTRTTQNSWGAADIGGTWTLFGGNGLGQAFSADGATGAIEVPTVGSGRSARLLGVFGRDVDVSATFRTDSAATGYGQYVSLIGRRSGTNLEYRARVRITSSGQFFLGATKLVGTSSEQLIDGEEPVDGLTHLPGTDYRVRAQFDGADPTTIRVRVWAAAEPEPSTWTLVRTDDQIQMQSGGSIGLNVGLSSSAAIAPVLFELDDVAGRLITDAPTGTIAVGCVGLDCTFDAAGVADPDGSIASYLWDFGDGATASGPTAAHTYALGGPKSVVLRVVDNEGAVADVTETADPFGPNQDPIAAFDVACLALSCGFDGSTSVDPDGTIVEYAWALGDGTTADGASIQQSFATAGTYPVTLTITDDRDGTDSVTIDVTVVDVIASDAFERVESAGLGIADIGGDWTVSGGSGATSFGVDGAVATVDVPAPATGRSMRLLSVDAAHVDLRALVRTDQDATGYGQYVSLIGRHQGTNLEYRARIRFNANGIFLGAVKNVNSSSELVIDGEERVDGVDHVAGQGYRVRAQFDGESPTTIRIKLWADGTPEPLGWDLIRTDDQAELQAAGAVGVNAALSGSATNAPVRFELDQFVVRPVGSPPVAAFTVSCVGLECSVDAASSADPDGAIASYAWDFGDGATATGVTTSHTYAFGGDKTITLTVVDDDGDQASLAQTANPEGVNQNPFADIVVDCVARTCAFDGSGASDLDGSVVAWAWDFGDGTLADGVSPIHAFATPGTNDVTLTVTDDDGATGSITVPVTVADEFVADAFGRIESGSWGTADQGGSWTRTSGPASAFEVDGSVGVMSIPAGSGRGQRIGPDVTISDVTMMFDADQTASGYGIMAAIVGRSIDTQNEYRARARISSTGAVYLALVVLDGSYSEQLIAGEVAVPGLVVGADDPITVRLRVEGTSPTSLSAKVWAATDPEPVEWALSVTDTTAALQTAGRVGVHGVLSSSADITPVAIRVSAFVAIQ